MECEDETNKPRLYQVNVIVLEGRHLAMKNANTYVILAIGGRKKKIRAKSNKTDSPHFNDFCTFSFNLPLTVLLDEILTVKVYQISRYIKKILGSFKVEMSTVWSQPNHQFYHKWAILADPKNTTEGIKGFLKCDIAILTRGVVLRAPEEHLDEKMDENLLVPFGTMSDRHRSKLVVSIYRADNFSASIPDGNEPRLSKPFIKVTYGGEIRKTRTAKNRVNPIWNEELTFLDMFPPLTQSIFVELCDNARTISRRSQGNTNIDISNLYENGENGFLPTFGPNFIYLYKPMRHIKRHKSWSSLENSFTYMARVLMAIRMEIIDYPEEIRVHKITRKILPQLINAIPEKKYFEWGKFVLFATIFDVLCFETKNPKQKVRFKVTLGPKNKVVSDEGKKKKKKKSKSKIVENMVEHDHLNVDTKCSSTNYKNFQLDQDYSFSVFEGKYPCIHVYGDYPNALRRIYRVNVVKKAFYNLVEEVNRIKYQLDYDFDRRFELSKKLRHILANFSKNCEDILNTTELICPGDTNLFKERKIFYHRELAQIAHATKVASRKRALHVPDTVQKLCIYLTRLRKLYQDPENSFPDTEIWMQKSGSKELQCRVRTEDITYSKNSLERGLKSGRLQTLLIKGHNNQLKAKLEVFMWFGRAEEFKHCFKLLPSGYTKGPPCESNVDISVPSKIIYEEKHYYEFKAHVFQGKILISFDESGLADPYVRIIIVGRNIQTQVRWETLSPIWDESLTIPSLELYGSPRFLKKNPIKVIVEVFDKEKVGKSELVGRAFIRPNVRLLREKSKPPKLKWEDISLNSFKVGQLLMVSELKQIAHERLENQNPESTPIPDNIRPHQVPYRLEIIFWGVRQIRKTSKLKNKGFVILEFGEHTLKSPLIKNVRHKLNFPYHLKFIDVDLPEESEYAPPLSIKLYSLGAFAIAKSYVASCIVPSLNYFYTTIWTEKEKKKQARVKIIEEKKKREKKLKKIKEKKKEAKKKSLHEKREKIIDYICGRFHVFFNFLKCKILKKCKMVLTAYQMEEMEEEITTWWVRYYASINEGDKHPRVVPFKIFQEELEAQPEFRGFKDFLSTFTMVTGHGIKSHMKVQAKVKAYLKIYKIPKGIEQDPDFETERQNLASTNEPIRILVRVYIVCGKNLAPRDIYGKSDPYIYLQLGKKRISDRKHYSPKQINPIFGRSFEIKATFPHDNLLNIKVIDYDSTSKDDLIGETIIDIENRYYSKYHASCGIAKEYHTEGINAWRDIYHPTDILNKVCVKSEMAPPVFKKDSVFVGKYEFKTPGDPEDPHREEKQALKVLHSWHKIPAHGFCLVPEHVETRSLYHPKLPGIEQGKLQMWVDLFPADYRFMPDKVDINPQKPVPMELRAIVWNVEDVVLDDRSFFFRDKMSDIYVKGWMLSMEEDMQKTDIHYRSLNGEGNFNWRFIFQFNYIPAEKAILVRKKIDAFDLNPEQTRAPCKLEIQIWDNDAFGDDYLGTLILELPKMPVGAKLPSRCTLKMLKPNYTKINLFRIKKTRGWWPFRRPKEKHSIGKGFDLTGKVDLELEVLTAGEAMERPAGKGRKEPDALPAPSRPSSSFNWMLNPLKTFRHIVLKKFLRFFLFVIFVVVVFLFIATAIYAFPNYAVKKLLRA